MGAQEGALQVEHGWACLRDADWARARDAFAARLNEQPDDPEALDGRGRSLWWLGQPKDGIERRREAYALYRRRGDATAAANLAVYLAAECRIAGDPAAANGWLARAERLLTEAAPCVERGWLEIERAKRAAGDPGQHALPARAAVTVAQDLRDPDLEAAGLAQLGLARVDAGDAEGGLRPARRGDDNRHGGRGSRPPVDRRHVLHDTGRVRPARRPRP